MVAANVTTARFPRFQVSFSYNKLNPLLAYFFILRKLMQTNPVIICVITWQCSVCLVPSFFSHYSPQKMKPSSNSKPWMKWLYVAHLWRHLMAWHQSERFRSRKKNWLFFLEYSSDGIGSWKIFLFFISQCPRLPWKLRKKGQKKPELAP